MLRLEQHPFLPRSSDTGVFRAYAVLAAILGVIGLEAVILLSGIATALLTPILPGTIVWAPLVVIIGAFRLLPGCPFARRLLHETQPGRE